MSGNKKLTIAFVTFGNFDGHATLKRATGMAGPLIEAGHEVHLLLEESSINREKVTMECPEAIVHWHQRGSSPWSERKCKLATLDQLKPDLVWICGVGLRNWMRKSCKSSIVLADHSELYSEVTEGRIRRYVYSVLEWGYCFAFDGHVCASRYLEAFFRKRLKLLGKEPANVFYSPYAYHPDVIRKDPEGVAAVQARFPGKKLILYMGSFWENYGFWDMLEAFRRLSDKRSDFIALFAGRGPEKGRGLAWVAENDLGNSIVIEGYVPEERLSSYFGATHAFLSPLRDTVQDWARCPSKLYMYLPFNKPVITCPIGEAKELFGEGGAYYSPGDVDGLVQIIDDVLDRDWQDAGADPLVHTYHARTASFLEWYNRSFLKV